MTDFPSTTPRFCANCGTPIPSASNFCPSCGREVVHAQRLGEAAGEPAGAAVPPVRNAAPAAIAPEVPAGNLPGRVAPAPPSSARFWVVGVPVTLAIVGLLAWAVLAGLPFGGRERSERRPAREVAKVSEGSASTATVREIAAAGDDPDEVQPAPSIVELKPNTLPAPPPKPAISEPVGMPSEVPEPARPPLPPQREEGEMSQRKALDRLEAFLETNDPYGIPPDCYATRSLGYRNRGYTVDVVGRPCDRRPSPSGVLGRWRIDSVTGEIFRQNRAGRYVRP